ncbi:MAG: FxsA family protein [Solirubrobacterales bacterium]
MLLLVGLFILVPILELWVIIEVGGLIGILPTLALLLAMSILGATLLRHQGRDAWQRFNRAIAERRFPGREVADGLMITIGGVLLLTPGFITDAIGLLLLLPPTRAIARRLVLAYVGRRFVVAGVGLGGLGGTPGRDDSPSRDYDFDSTAEEIDDEDPRLPR